MARIEGHCDTPAGETSALGSRGACSGRSQAGVGATCCGCAIVPLPAVATMQAAMAAQEAFR